MSEVWGHFFCEMAGHTASVLFDDGIASEIDSLNLPDSLKVKIELQSWTAEGLTTNEEADRLEPLETQLEQTLKASGGVVLGRVTTNRVRWIMALVDKAQLDLSAVQQPWDDAGYKVSLSSKPDPQRSVYWRDLYPTVADRQVMGDLRVLAALTSQGDNRDAERPVDHWVYFPKRKSADAFADWAVSNGFSVEPVVKDSAFGKRKWLVRTNHVGTMHLDHITHHTLKQLSKAQELGGEYDGWETQVTT